mmetsp:Transcript_14538/g.43948  ORF Transcript_14538/g.43948 Transcript_14538/m.43948 type:complete len:154 (+) Transcript_14538:4406-4867(+)
MFHGLLQMNSTADLTVSVGTSDTYHRVERSSLATSTSCKAPRWVLQPSSLPATVSRTLVPGACGVRKAAEKSGARKCSFLLPVPIWERSTRGDEDLSQMSPVAHSGPILITDGIIISVPFRSIHVGSPVRVVVIAVIARARCRCRRRQRFCRL